MTEEITIEQLADWARDSLPGLLGVEFLAVAKGRVEGRLPVRKALVAGNGALWAPAIIGLTDCLCAYGVSTVWPQGATGFTTVDLTCNFLGTVRAGAVRAVAQMLHGGRQTQVWDAHVTDEGSGKLLAAFRCTQIILYPRPHPQVEPALVSRLAIAGTANIVHLQTLSEQSSVFARCVLDKGCHVVM